MLRRLIDYLNTKGHRIPEEVILEFYREEFGELPTEWTADQKKNVRKAVSKELEKFSDRFQFKPVDEFVEYLWAAGWEYRDVRGQVFGLEKWVANWVEQVAPEEDLELSREEAEDPYLKEVLQILKDFYVKPDARECRMILRRKSVPWTVRYACELFRAHAKPQRHYTVKNILDEADFRWSVRNDRNHDPI